MTRKASRVGKRLACVFTFIMAVGLTGNAGAITLGYPDINFDSHQGAGANTFGVSGVHYAWSTGNLTVSAKALAIAVRSWGEDLGHNLSKNTPNGLLLKKYLRSNII